MTPKRCAAVYALVLAAFTVYLALDTFVLGSVYTEDASVMNTEMFATPEPTPAPTPEPTPEDTIPLGYTETTYRDENLRIELREYVEYNTHIYVADVTVSSAEYLKTAFADDRYGKNITRNTSEIAAAHNAVLAVNGDYYGAQEKGLVLRNGVLYRAKPSSGREVLCVWAGGVMEVMSGTEYDPNVLPGLGAWQVFSFGPGLVRDGRVSVEPGDEVRTAAVSNPRTAIGMIEPLHYVLVVSDGRTDESEGLSLFDLATFMTTLGVRVGYNLDGGGSSTMVFNGRVINKPTSYGKIRERGVSDIVYFG